MIAAMPIRLTHVLDEATPEDGVRLLSLLLRLMPAGQIDQRVIVVGREPPMLRVPEGIELTRVGKRFDSAMVSAPDLQRAMRAQRPDVVHTFGAAAAAAAGTVRAAFGGAPVVTTICDPNEAGPSSRWWRSMGGVSGTVDILCPSGIVQRKLVESGIPIEATAVIRPGVDFGEIRRAKETRELRIAADPNPRRQSGAERHGLSPPHSREGYGYASQSAISPVLLTASPPSREGGQYFAVWAMAILHQLWPEARLIVPGASREQQRLRRLIEQVYCPQVYVLTGDRYSPAELLAVSDALVVPAIGDISTGWLAWAMAASVPIIGSAVPAVAEFIADKHNGFLCKPGEPHTLAIRIRTVLESPEMFRPCVETARSQAYDVFRAQRCVDEYLKVFRNLLRGDRAISNVQDAAIDA